MPQIAFPSLNRGYNASFKAGRMSIGLVAPLERYHQSAIPDMSRHVERAKLAEALGFSALWIRDVPFNVPDFGDVGQIYDPFVYLGFLSAHTQTITLGVASIILPLRHPAHVAKAAASADQLSGGRLVLGVASGDRPDEYPALNMTHDDRGARFASAYVYIRDMAASFPAFQSPHGRSEGEIDMLPKPSAGRLPLLITGASQQNADWLAQHGDGWITYPRPPHIQARLIAQRNQRIEASGGAPSPVMQSLYIDLLDEFDAPPQPIHLGFRSGAAALIDHLTALENAGVNHVALNLRFNQADIDDTMHRLSEHILPVFHASKRAAS
ncbi:LLM class oxidoreductase [Oceanicaulis sp.]|uniref:LLM class oxidoreductase n=1 Tax=Oceanicaulis sp. TaxID=1924941 RepID=UPI003D274F07